MTLATKSRWTMFDFPSKEPIEIAEARVHFISSGSLHQSKLITRCAVTADAIFSGITTFAKLPWVQCLTMEQHIPFDIAFIGAPFVSFCATTRGPVVKPSSILGYRDQLQTRRTFRARFVCGIYPS